MYESDEDDTSTCLNQLGLYVNYVGEIGLKLDHIKLWCDAYSKSFGFVPNTRNCEVMRAVESLLLNTTEKLHADFPLPNSLPSLPTIKHDEAQ